LIVYCAVIDRPGQGMVPGRRSGLMKSWSWTTEAILPVSLTRPRPPHPFPSPRGGLRGRGFRQNWLPLPRERAGVRGGMQQHHFASRTARHEGPWPAREPLRLQVLAGFEKARGGDRPSPQPSPQGGASNNTSAASVLERGLWPPWQVSEKPLPVSEGGVGGAVPAEPAAGTRFRAGWALRNCR